jgi:hypothetical protein
LYCNHLMSDGRTCRAPALKGELVCLFHSKSARAKAALAAHRSRGRAISRAQLLRGLSKDFETEKNHRVRATIAALIKELMDDRDDIAELKRMLEAKR